VSDRRQKMGRPGKYTDHSIPQRAGGQVLFTCKWEEYVGAVQLTKEKGSEGIRRGSGGGGPNRRSSGAIKECPGGADPEGLCRKTASKGRLLTPINGGSGKSHVGREGGKKGRAIWGKPKKRSSRHSPSDRLLLKRGCKRERVLAKWSRKRELGWSSQGKQGNAAVAREEKIRRHHDQMFKNEARGG